MDANDVFRLRAEEFERSFYDLRRIEWIVVVQIFTGYAALATGYWQWHVAYPKDSLPSCLCMFSLSILWLATTYYSYCLQIRLQWTRKMQNDYLRKLHNTCNAEEIQRDGPRNSPWYAFAVQLSLSTLTFIGTLAFVLSTRPQ
jgi:hypothetical protein